MATSEIDDIFAAKVTSKTNDKNKGKGRTVDLLPTPSSSSTPALAPVKKKKTKKDKDKKRKRQEDEPLAAPSVPDLEHKANEDHDDHTGIQEIKAKPKRQRVVETIQDASASLSSSIKQKSEISKGQGSSKATRGKKVEKRNTDDLERFKDSRGTGPRKRTEEGFLVYKEDELGIRDSGGDTPLCPFDCNCCF